MASGLQNQNGGYGMTEETPSGVWQHLRAWLLGSTLGAAIMLVPAAAHAKETHHLKHVAHHVAHVHAHQSAGHHVAHHTSAAHVTHTAYRPESHSLRHEQDVHLTHADYRTREHHSSSFEREHGVHLIHADYRTGYSHYGHRISAHFSYSRLQCVPYAREVSHIELSGNAFLWWAEAAGRYERGYVPAIGSVLNFRATGRMPLGHVAVVTAVMDSRTILVTQANWVPGTVTNDVTVQDVSPENNWSAVRVEYGNGDSMGSVYPTYGFIYNRPADTQTIYAANAGGRNEVAEAPVVQIISAEAPNRSLR